ncbi:hypothetical protein [Nocardiopsis coralliicola]
MTAVFTAFGVLVFGVVAAAALAVRRARRARGQRPARGLPEPQRRQVERAVQEGRPVDDPGLAPIQRAEADRQAATLRWMPWPYFGLGAVCLAMAGAVLWLGPPGFAAFWVLISLLQAGLGLLWLRRRQRLLELVAELDARAGEA